MSTKPFRFKQFSLEQDQCAMKVGTDGVLLGAWCDVKNSNNVLDIGTGTGLIALMIAQRNSKSLIRAIEIDNSAAKQAAMNFKNSKWSNRCRIQNVSLQNYIPNQKFDLIVSNPPYFESVTLSGKEKRNLARHANKLKISEILKFGKEHLNLNGKLSLIFPAEQLESNCQEALQTGMHIQRITRVYSKSDKLSRVLISFVLEETNTTEDEIIIEENGRHKYSNAYTDLCKDFYLKM